MSNTTITSTPRTTKATAVQQSQRPVGPEQMAELRSRKVAPADRAAGAAATRKIREARTDWQKNVASAGRTVSGWGKSLDGMVRGQIDKAERAGGRHPMARFLGGVAHGLSLTVTGTVGLVGDSMQLADKRVRDRAAQTVAAIARNPGAALGAARDAAVAAYQRDPARFAGEVVGNLVPIGAAASAASKASKVGALARATQVASKLTARAARATDAVVDGAKKLAAARPARIAGGAAKAERTAEKLGVDVARVRELNLRALDTPSDVAAHANKAFAGRSARIQVSGYSAAPAGTPYTQNTERFVDSLTKSLGQRNVGLITSPTADKGSIDAITTMAGQNSKVPVLSLTAKGYVKYIDPSKFSEQMNKQQYLSMPKFVFEGKDSYNKATALASNSFVAARGRDVTVFDFMRAVEQRNESVIVGCTTGTLNGERCDLLEG